MIRAYSRAVLMPQRRRRERAVAAFPVVPVLASEKNICHRRQWWAGRGGEGGVASMIDTRT